jgi:MFS family permease
MILFSVIIAIGSNPWVILAFAPILGVSINVFTMASAYIGDNAPRDQIDRVMGWALLSQGTGFGLGPILAGFTIQYLSFEVTYFIAGVFGFAALLISFAKMRQPSKPRSNSPSGISGGSVWRRLFARARERDLLSIGGITMFLQFAMLVTLTFLPLRARSLGIDLTTVGTIVGTRTLFSTVVRFVPGRTSSKVGRLNLLLISVVLSGAGLGFMSVSNNFETFTLAGILEGVGYGLYLTVSRALIASVTHTSRLGVSLGFLDTFGALGQTVLIFVIGAIAQSVGLQIGFETASGLVLFGGLTSFFVLRRVKSLH